jgi:fermentation-respiration switch protein FrsA (DUF1100 family)
LGIFILAGAVLAFVLFAVGGFGWLAAGRLTARRAPDPPDSPAAHGLPFETIQFPARDGLRLGGWYVTRGGPRSVVILCPGHNGSMDADLKHAPWLYEAGFDLLLFDWRAHGVSEGQRVTMGVHERLDLLGALDFLRGRGVTHVGLLGFSMGGAVALRVAADDDTGLVKAVVSDGGFAHLRSAIAGFFVADLGLPPGVGRLLGRFAVWAAGLRVGVPLSEADPLPHVARVAPRPILFIHGAHDPFAPLADQDALFDAARQPKTLWRVSDAGHRNADTLHPAEYQQRVVGFFKQHLIQSVP